MKQKSQFKRFKCSTSLAPALLVLMLGAQTTAAETDTGKTDDALPGIEEIHAAMLEAEALRKAVSQPDPAVSPAFNKRWGVQVIGVWDSADGFWLNFRFRVTDPEKAQVLFDSRLKPYLESETSGLKMAVPSAAKVGSLRTTNRGHNIKPGRIYTIMFANPEAHIKIGQKVSVVVGDFKTEHLTVRGNSLQQTTQLQD